MPFQYSATLRVSLADKSPPPQEAHRCAFRACWVADADHQNKAAVDELLGQGRCSHFIVSAQIGQSISAISEDCGVKMVLAIDHDDPHWFIDDDVTANQCEQLSEWISAYSEQISGVVWQSCCTAQHVLTRPQFRALTQHDIVERELALVLRALPASCQLWWQLPAETLSEAQRQMEWLPQLLLTLDPRVRIVFPAVVRQGEGLTSHPFLQYSWPSSVPLIALLATAGDVTCPLPMFATVEQTFAAASFRHLDGAIVVAGKDLVIGTLDHMRCSVITGWMNSQRTVEELASHWLRTWKPLQSLGTALAATRMLETWQQAQPVLALEGEIQLPEATLSKLKELAVSTQVIDNK